MDSSNSTEVAHDHSPFLKIYKDGRIERIVGTEIAPPSLDPQTGVESKDVVISPETGVSARLYIPKTTPKKLPLLVYFHGGGFCIETAFSPQYHNGEIHVLLDKTQRRNPSNQNKTHRRPFFLHSPPLSHQPRPPHQRCPPTTGQHPKPSIAKLNKKKSGKTQRNPTSKSDSNVSKLDSNASNSFLMPQICF
jgi:hypothetical protein